MMFSSDILDKDRFWNEEMKQVNKSTLMGCSINFQETEAEKHGIQSGHAYSVLRTAEWEGERLVHVSWDIRTDTQAHVCVESQGAGCMFV